MTRKIHELGPVGQLAYLPSDFDATLKYWTQTMGVGPFFLMENIQLTDCKYKGVPTDAMFSIAIAYWGDVQIELIRPEQLFLPARAARRDVDRGVDALLGE